MTIWTIIASIPAVLAIALLVAWLSTRDSHPYRVCQNGSGRYLVQQYQCVTPNWVSCEATDPRKDWRKYDFVTVAEFDTLDEATASYRSYMESYRQAEAVVRAREAAEAAELRKKELDNTIVKVYSIKG